ncbi:ryncolin-2-like [Anopheles coustani]|uniref:ryncolin-2-like n=1 Tax=Anopheles coustani TaxID=139045 RepID=UPI002657C7E3|nr:ryncolin-2-like [Anopheles coustani]
MPTVMDAIVHAMIDFRKEILDNLQLSFEYHTKQLEEIKVHVEHKMQEQENRMKKQNEEIRKTLGEISSESVLRSCDRVKTNYTSAFYISPHGNIEKPFLVLCYFDNNFNMGGGWTVFQRRIDGSVDFYQNWTMYKNGFGDVNGEHWLGLEKLHIMTRSGRYELLVLLEDFDENSTYALYDQFKIGSEEEKYELTVGGYSAAVGDSLKYHNGRKFSTFDQDNNEYSKNCAKEFRGAWWFTYCYHTHLNGPYFEKGQHEKDGISWYKFRRDNYSLKSSTMMFRSRASN